MKDMSTAKLLGGYDILGLTELHNKQRQEQYKGKRWIPSELANEQDGKCVDPAAGVAIMLSAHMTDLVMARGCIGTRIAWLRLEGPVCNMFFIVTYIPHKGRQSPSAEDTIAQVSTLMGTVHSSDCIVLCGDFNCQLQRHVKNYTDK